MSKHQEKRYLFVKDFDDAIRQSVDLLHESDVGAVEGKTKSFEWFDHGGSAVLRAIAKLLKSTICEDSDTRKQFDRIVHVDCSLWKNKRTMQRAIADELNLHHVFPIFDKQDEEDDFRGVDAISREQMPVIGRLINKSLRDERFLMIFHYGGIEDIDLAEFGIPFFGKGKLLWTSAGRFFHFKRGEVRLMQTVADISINMVESPPSSEMIDRILHEDAIAVIGETGMDGINPEIVSDCFVYYVYLTIQLHKNSIGVDYDWATHACNYWVCDGILGEEEACWEIGNTLYGVIPRLGNPSTKPDSISYYLDRKKRSYKKVWYSVTSNKQEKHDISVPRNASSYFLTSHREDPVYVRNDLFQLASTLRVLKLCNCSFDFASPPFRSCHNLRFLWLEHCTNTWKEQSGVPIFPNLLVFDLRFTDYVLLPQMVELMTNLRELNIKGVSWKNMSHVWKNLKKLHKLRITKYSDVITVDSWSYIDMMNLELLDLSCNTHMESLPTLSSARSLKILVLDGCSSLEDVILEGAPPLLESFSFDGCSSLEDVILEGAPPLLESFSFDGCSSLEDVILEGAPPLLESFSFDDYGQAENWTHYSAQKLLRPKYPKRVQVAKISLQGCGRLQNLFLRALPNLKELDLSGTAINILDLCAMNVPELKKLFLLGCQQLRRLIWDGSPKLEVIQVDTEREARSCPGEQRSIGNGVFIAFTDGRFIWSAARGLFRYTSSPSRVYLLISCTIHSQANITRDIKEIGSSEEDLVPTRLLLPYNNDTSLAKDVTCSSLAWNHQRLQTSDLHMEIGKGSYNLERMHDNPDFLSFMQIVRSMHLHDNSAITVIPLTGINFSILKWFHVERCSKLHTLFPGRDGVRFAYMRIFSASDLPAAYCIWGRSIDSENRIPLQQLQHIYLFNCPRLVFVLPISFSLPNLETLQIAYCRSLRHVFPLDDKYPPAISSGVTFRNLKQIKLYHLHNLEQICEPRLTAPALQTIGIRDCWGLRRLPAVARQSPKPVVDCEKDWWNKLEWDVGHDPSLFETRHSAYYKKTLPRVSVLR